MSSMLRILLSQCIEKQQDGSNQILVKSENVLQEVSRLMYRLLCEDKIELLEAIFVNLKKEQEKGLNKGSVNKVIVVSEDKNNKGNTVVYHSELLNKLSLEEYISYSSNRTNPNNNNNQCQLALFKQAVQDMKNNKLARTISFWTDYIFVQRRITVKEIILLEKLLKYFHTGQQQQRIVSKCQLLIKLAKENANRYPKEYLEQNKQQQLLEQTDRKYKWVQQQLIAQGECNRNKLVIGKHNNVKFSEEQLSQQATQSDSLLNLYQHYIQLFLSKQSLQSVSISHKPILIISSLITITKQHPLKVVQQQAIEVIEQMRIQSLELFKLINQFSQNISLEDILYKTGKYWLTVTFVEQLLQFFIHNYQQQLSNYQNINNQQKQTTTISDELSNIQAILNVIGQFYQSVLDQVLCEVLVQGLERDIKNNYYLNEKKSFLHISNIINMIKYWLNGHSVSSQISKTKYCQQLLQAKSLKCTNSTSLNNLFKLINDKLNKIVSFLSFQQQGAQNRLLSLQEYQGKKLSNFIRIAYSNKSQLKQQSHQHQHQQQQSSIAAGQVSNMIELFLMWFVYDYEWSNNNPSMKVQVSSTKQQSQLVQQTYNKLISRLFSSSSFKTHTIISAILNLESPNTTIIPQTFQFHSPTFNSQYLTFNYIYGEMKDKYFYHNHHYSHVLLNLYTLLLQHLQSSIDINNKNNDNNNRAFLLTIFNTLRNSLGQYAKDQLLQANSKQFYQYLNLFKFCYITFTKQFLSIIPFDELVLAFDLILNEIIVKENHPLIRQYIEIIMSRIYFTIKEKPGNNNNKAELFYQCRNRMINMLDYDKQNIHNLNIAVPILMILGHELISFIQSNPTELLQQYKHKSNNQQQQIQDQFGSKQIKPFHQIDIHYILVKYISCHVAYMRVICQYYMSKFVKLIKDQNQDVLLMNLVNFWHSDKDSVKIMANIAIVIEGFKNQMNLFHTQSKINTFYLCFQRVQEQPSIQAQYFLVNDTILVFEKIIKNMKLNYELKLLFVERILALKSQGKQIKNKLIESFLSKNKITKNQPKKVQISKEKLKKIKPTKEDKRAQNKQLIKQKLLQKVKLNKQKEETQQIIVNQQQITRKLSQDLHKSYQTYQEINEPNVIIIATLLEKIHNFGYLVRTLTNHNAMLTVPSSQPFVHPQCKQLLPREEDIDVKVIEVKEKNLESFIRMYQQRGYPLIALEQCSKSITLQKTVFPQKYMLLLGNQRIGAPSSLLNMADILVQIPQIGKVRSLNVHVSMVICFWQYLKQKNQKKALQNK